MKLPELQKKTTLDKDLNKFVRLEQATAETGQQIVKVGLGVLFLAAVWVIATIGYYDIGLIPVTENAAFVVGACIIGGYMALNIGANDVANNVGPAVGSKALTLVGALFIAAIFEAAGAILAGGDVVSTIKNEIIDPAMMPSTDTFIRAMLAALLAAALWLNLATYFGAPVSTTHSIVGGVMGAGIAATGLGAVNWLTMTKIAASWVISPVMGGLIAAAFLAFIKSAIYNAEDMIAAAKRWVPVLVAIMVAAFSIYLVMKGLKKLWTPESWVVATIGGVAFAVCYAAARPAVAKASVRLEKRRKAVSSLFTIPLICSAALLSFAHGANDVANAVAPLAAIVDAVSSGGISAQVGVPIWVMLVGAVGIAAGLGTVRPEADSHGRPTDHQAGPRPGLLHRPLGGDHGDHRLGPGVAGEFHPHRRGRRLRRRFPARISRPRPASGQGKGHNRRRGKRGRGGGRQPGVGGIGGLGEAADEAPQGPRPQAGPPQAPIDHRRRLGGDGALGGVSCGDPLLRFQRVRLARISQTL